MPPDSALQNTFDEKKTNLKYLELFLSHDQQGVDS